VVKSELPMLNVHLRINDAATGRPTPVRVRVSAADGTAFPPLGRSAEVPGGRNEDVGGHLRVGRERWWYIDGACEIPLPTGVSLRVQVAKGPEFTPLDETVTLGAGQISLRFAISRWADAYADGWVSVDTRCHFITPHAALLEAQAEGVDVVNLLATPFPMLALDANTYTTTPNLLAFSGQVPALERYGCAVVVNTFNTHPVLGKVALLNSHRPVFPLAFGGEDTDDWGVCDWCDQCRRKKGLTVWAEPFEAAAGMLGGEALVAAILGKIDAVEMSAKPRKLPLLPWVYQFWDAGVLVPLVGASGKDSNATRLGAVRTYARPPLTSPREGEVASAASRWGVSDTDEGATSPPPAAVAKPPAATSPSRGEVKTKTSWLDAVRAGRTFASAGPLLTFALEGSRLRASGRASGTHGKLEVVANGALLASADAQPAPEGTYLRAELEVEAPASGWVAVRWGGDAGFAHSSPLAVGERTRKPEAVAALCKLVEQTREWAEAHGRFTNPRRKQALLDRCADAVRVLEGPP
jgi:hypothetical protein